MAKELPEPDAKKFSIQLDGYYEKFLKGQCGKPKRKIKSSSGSIHLTNELYKFEETPEGIKLFIGAKKNNIGYLTVRFYTKKFQEPKSIYIRKQNGKYSVSFCYDDGITEEGLFNDKENLELLRDCTKEYLEHHTFGIDRGVVRPVQFGAKVFDFADEQKRKKLLKEKYIKRYQKRLAKQKKGSKQREKNKSKIAKTHKKIANMRLDFCHKTSKAMVNDKKEKVLIFEDLRTKGMTKKPTAKPNGKGGWDRNNANAKAGLNKSILDKSWHKLEELTK